MGNENNILSMIKNSFKGLSSITKTKTKTANEEVTQSTNLNVKNFSQSDNSKNEVKRHVYKVGDSLNLGSYDNAQIQWTVIYEESNRVCLISKRALCCMPFNNELKEVTWEYSTLRKWLNEYFFENAFNKDEKARLLSNKILPENLSDKICILSIDEYEEYFNGELNWNCLTKDGVKVQCWLRNIGRELDKAAFIGRSGSIHSGGSLVNSARNAVRPIIWISTNE